MDGREAVSRPGGRSARVQAAVHAAVQDLLAEMGREALTIPMVAARAGVTPSTIYRRWGDLQDLLGDVAVERLRPDAPPPDRGSYRDDLLAWLEQYADEMSSAPGRAMIRDVLASAPEASRACRCLAFTRDQLLVMAERAARRGEAAPDADDVLDATVAPVMFRILFGSDPVTPAYCRHLVDRLLSPGTV
ncbi:TetR/AcrR family transcriptional regulator [Azospirillum sp. ST 5-10]|uniref:TetR/AcrR family transcriptional regulator n=1 Tax=unclassified Azospirillum TaxID=2630922 RepID=UPI003F4A489C